MYVDLKTPSNGPCVIVGSPFTFILLKKAKMKADYLQNQSQSIEHMASTMEMDSKYCHVLFQAQIQIIVDKANKIKINNLKVTEDFGLYVRRSSKKRLMRFSTCRTRDLHPTHG
jgi:hypothetical protein